jgi:hypothetical protein
MDVMIPKKSYLGAALDPAGFFSEMYQGLKDGANYVISKGNQPYIQSSTLTYNKDVASVPYWFSYKNFLAKAKPDGYLTSVKKGYKISDAGFATQNKKIIAFDFIFNGHKTVVANSADIMLTQVLTAFNLTEEKAAKLRELNYQLAATTASMKKVGIKLAAVRANNDKLNADQRKMVDGIEAAYNKNLIALGKTSGIKITASAKSGLGEPVSIVVVSLIVIVVSALALFAVYEVVKLITDAKKYQDEADTQDKILTTYLAALSDPKTTPEEKKAIQAKIDQIQQKSEDKQSDIIKSEASVGDIFSSIKNYAVLGILGFAAYKGYQAFK